MSSGIHQRSSEKLQIRWYWDSTKPGPSTGCESRTPNRALGTRGGVPRQQTSGRRDNTVLVTCTDVFQLRVNSTATARGTSTEDLDVRVGRYIFISPLILTVRWRTECGRRSSGRPRMHEEYSDKLSALIPRITIVIFKFSIHYLASELSPGGHVHVRQ